jgi:hypothetical protein
MRIIDWLRGRDERPPGEQPEPEKSEADEEWAEDDELPGDEDDPTVYPLW